jgi:RNA polymerase sigma-70 factor (ECF subfamily)
MDPRNDENALIQSALLGEQKAYYEIMHTYKDVLFTFIVRMLKNREDAEEILQDVFINAFKKLDTFKGESSLSTWLFRISKNLTINRMKARRLKVVPLESMEIPEGTTLDKKFREDFLLYILSHLDEQEQLLLNLFYAGQLSIVEIGELLDISPGNVKVRLHRSRNKFRDIFLKISKKENIQFYGE